MTTNHSENTPEHHKHSDISDVRKNTQDKISSSLEKKGILDLSYLQPQKEIMDAMSKVIESAKQNIINDPSWYSEQAKAIITLMEATLTNNGHSDLVATLNHSLKNIINQLTWIFNLIGSAGSPDNIQELIHNIDFPKILIAISEEIKSLELQLTAKEEVTIPIDNIETVYLGSILQIHTHKGHPITYNREVDASENISLHDLHFKILLHELSTNYGKYGTNGQVSIKKNENWYLFHWENDIKKESTIEVHSTLQGTKEIENSISQLPAKKVFMGEKDNKWMLSIEIPH